MVSVVFPQTTCMHFSLNLRNDSLASLSSLSPDRLLPKSFYRQRGNDKSSRHCTVNCRLARVKASPSPSLDTLIREPHKYFDQVTVPVRAREDQKTTTLILLSQTFTLRRHFVTRLFSPSSSETQTCNPSSSNRKYLIHGSGYDFFLRKNFTGSSLISVGNSKLSSGSDLGLLNSIHFRLFSSQVAVELSTSDGLTVEGIIANQWPILEESESDWKSHASAIAQSIHLIKKRLQWKKLLFRLELLSSQLDKPDLWDDPVRAGRISWEHGSLIGKMKEVKAFEQELLEHIEMIKLSREESDADLEAVVHWWWEGGIR
ncbi:hypothetical protein LOK49_LG11G00995 [Camellia lanceoleosa]|uniref:Uncharacterized protein n=1 Tax=Camellia lanceoleosa TaxID=1840588 RepID=A0ACC0G3G0_9ERIC|nr:hypothetical protein LOK49_LG11G00995 [Camellia lanceoleosa]